MACYRKNTALPSIITYSFYSTTTSKKWNSLNKRQKFELVKSQTKYCIYIILFLYLHIASFIIVYTQMTINNYLKLFIVLNRLYTKQFQQIMKFWILNCECQTTFQKQNFTAKPHRPPHFPSRLLRFTPPTTPSPKHPEPPLPPLMILTSLYDLSLIAGVIPTPHNRTYCWLT